MKKTASSEGFGKPKPLPNEAGYKTVKETEKLERESKEMEARLQMLQLRMQQQKEDDDATPKIGGSRWKSGRADKGNIRGYAKDVHEKIKRSEQRIESKRNQQAAKPMMSQTTGGLDFAALNKHQPVGMGSENRQQQRQQPEQMPIQGMKTTVPLPAVAGAGAENKSPEAAFRKKEVHSWTVQDVKQWLQSVQLIQYVSQFEENEINGPILLEISLEDLDYMGVKILGHRKVLLKGIEDLRKNKRVTINLQAPLSPSKNTNAAIIAAAAASSGAGGAPSSRTQNVYESLGENEGPSRAHYAPRIPSKGVDHSLVEEEAETTKKIHWSQVEPLQDQQEKRGLKNDVDALHHANPADGMIDEDEERRLFQEAVAQWRGESSSSSSSSREKEASKVKIFRDGQEVKRLETDDQRAAARKAHEEGMWMNPYGAIADGEGNQLGPNSDLLSDSPLSSSSSAKTNIKAKPTGGNNPHSGSLQEAANSDLDEEAERAAFAAAVAEWRGGDSAKSKSNNSTEEGTGTTTTAPTVGVGGGGKAIAEQLAAQMEQEAKEAEQAMERKMAELTAKLDEARRQAVISTAEEGSPGKMGEFDDSLDSTSTANANDVSFSYIHETRPVNHGLAIGQTSREDDADASKVQNDLDRPLTPQSDDDDKKGDFHVGISSARDDAPMSARSATQPVISVVETSFGAEELDQAQADEEYYVVEESDDDD